ncbi:Hypothetical predicted protein, partial [Olea europaea subsp. europaea]
DKDNQGLIVYRNLVKVEALKIEIKIPSNNHEDNNINPEWKWEESPIKLYVALSCLASLPMEDLHHKNYTRYG